MVLAAELGGLALLLVLACPVSMGLMMLFMGRGMRSHHNGDGISDQSESLAHLKAEQARLAAKIEALEEPDPDRPGSEPQRIVRHARLG